MSEAGLDTEAPRSPWVLRWSRPVATAVGVASIAVGLAVLAGYGLEVARLVQVRSGYPPMYPNAAVAFVLLGSGLVGWLWLPRPLAGRVATGLGAVVLSGAVLVLALHAVGASATVLDTGLLPDDPVVAPTTDVAGRLTVESAMAIALLGLALVRIGQARGPGAAGQIAASLAALVGLMAVVGYFYGVDRTDLGDAAVPAVGMAIHTAVVIVGLAVALLLARPLVGWVGVVSSDSAAGSLARRLFLVALGVPLVLTGALALVTDNFVDETPLALSILAVGQVALIGLVLLSPIGTLARLDRERSEALDAAQRDRETLEDQAPFLNELRRQLSSEPGLTDPALALACHAEPAHGVLAGDWFDVIPAPGRRYRLAMMDVSGHGAVPAMFGLRLKDHLTDSLHRDLGLVEAVARLRPLFDRVEFIATALVVEVDLDKEVVRWVNAGHPPAILTDGTRLECLDGTGPLLGLADSNWAEQTLAFRPGQVMVAFTDGITEARDGRGHLFGTERVTEEVIRWARDGADAVVSATMAAARRHGQDRFTDDATLVALEFVAARRQGS